MSTEVHEDHAAQWGHWPLQITVANQGTKAKMSCYYASEGVWRIDVLSMEFANDWNATVKGPFYGPGGERIQFEHLEELVSWAARYAHSVSAAERQRLS